MRVVLIIENEEAIRLFWEGRFARVGVETVSASTLEEAREKFPLRKWDAIVFDACLHTESSIDCLPLLAWIAETYKGPKIAASNEAENRKEQMKNGCTHEAVDGKTSVPALVLSIFEIEFSFAEAA